MVLNWWTRSKSRQQHGRKPDVRTKRRPQVELLEDRTVLSGMSLAGGQDWQAAFAQLPLSFEVNRGQTSPDVDFLARGTDYVLFLTPDEAVLSLHNPTAAPGEPAADVLRMKLVGANGVAHATGQDLLPGKTNYFIGNDPSQWHTDISNFEKVRYENVYAGIDLLYYGNQGKMEYDFVVSPGANPADIQISYQGASGLELDDRGNLVLHTTGGDVVQDAPVLFQIDNGVRKAVDGHFVLAGNQVRFAVGAYDASQPLIIDPTLDYSTYHGGAGDDSALGIAVDGSGIYFAGNTSSANYPVQGPFQGTLKGFVSAFATKLNLAGTARLYSTYLGGVSVDLANAIAVDGSGNAVITGSAGSFDYPMKNAIQPNMAGGFADAFVTKLNAAGNDLVYSTFLGGDADESGNAVVVTSGGKAFITGNTGSTNFPRASAFQNAIGGATDAFLTVLNAAGTSLQYSTYLGGSGDDFGNTLAIDGAENVYVGGKSKSTNFPTLNPFQAANAGGNDGIVTKFNAGGGSLAYSTYLGGAGEDLILGMAIDLASNVYLTGSTTSDNYPKQGAIQNARGGLDDAFLTKLNPAGAALVYSTYLGGTLEDVGFAVTIDSIGDPFVVGRTKSTDFPTLAPLQTNNAGAADAFLTQYDPFLTGIVFSTYLGGAGDDQGSAIAIDAATRDLYIAGSTDSSNFPTVNPIQANNAAATKKDAFIARIGGAAGALQFPAATVQIAETGGNLVVNVNRVGGNKGAVAVQFATANGTALAGTDYTASSGTLNWADGDAATKSFNVPIIDDLLEGQGNQTFTISLTGPTNGAALGTPNTLTVTITEVAETSSVQFSAATYQVLETAGTIAIAVTRTGGTTGPVTVNYATSNGTAIAGTHYTATSGTLNWADGDGANKTFNVPIIDIIAPPTGDKVFNLALTGQTGGNLGTPNTATVTINEVSSTSSLQFTAASYLVQEISGSALITVTRTGGTGSAVSVNFATSNGTALAGTHYTATAGTLNWAAGETANKTFTVPILDDGVIGSPDRTFNVALTGPTGDSVLGTPNTSAVTITESNPNAGQLVFSAATYSVTEEKTSIVIAVNRINASQGAISVQFATSNGTALANGDYTATSGTLTWQNGDSAPKTFTVPIADDNLVEAGGETFNVTLSNPTSGASLGTPSTAVVTITDPELFSFSAATYQVLETLGTVTITVNRANRNNLPVSVNFVTTNGTATAPADYTTTTGTLNWAAGDTTPKTFSIPIVDDRSREMGGQTVNIALNTPSTGAKLGAPNTAVLTILDTCELLTQTQCFVTNSYVDLLGRQPDQGGLDFYDGILSRGGSRADVVNIITSSIEYRTKVVTDLNVLVFGVPPSQAKLKEGTDSLAAGGTREQLEIQYLGSPEFFAGPSGNTVNGFLTALYGIVLNRQVDPSAQSYFTNLISLGTTRQTVARTVLSSPESNTLEVTAAYQHFLHRQPDAGGLQFFVNALNSGLTNEQLQLTMMTSSEYFDLS